MTLHRFGDWPIAAKVMSILVAMAVLVTAGVLFFYLPLLEQKLTSEKIEATKHAVEIACSAVSNLEARVKAGELSTAEGQRLAKAAVKALRYGQGDYFWINDLGPTMVMHPISPELDGTPLGEKKDPNGKYL
ncbi:MAG: cache domain-containing protein, partial [Deltaproteobacteria bacterium]|nr:cache domain-containing protein [Deltaproteobacteria bacterium]